MSVQRERIQNWCSACSYELADTFFETMSGGRADNRPELQNALTAVCKTRVVLVVHSLSRLARSVRDTIAIAERLERHGANLTSLNERIDTTSALGKMVFRLLSTLNEFERDQLAERTANAMAHLRRCNRRISFRIPFGYDLAQNRSTLVPNTEEQIIITRICLLRQKGVSFERIAAALDSENVPTKSGGRWFGSSVRGIVMRKSLLEA